MKTKLIIAAIAAAAVASTACAAPMRSHRSHAKGESEAATKVLNQKSLEQASAGSTGSMMTPRNGGMSGMGSAAPMTPDAAPMGSPNNSMAPGPRGDSMTPPATPTTPQ